MSEKMPSAPTMHETHDQHEQPPVPAEVAQTMGGDAVKMTELTIIRSESKHESKTDKDAFSWSDTAMAETRRLVEEEGLSPKEAKPRAVDYADREYAKTMGYTKESDIQRFLDQIREAMSESTPSDSTSESKSEPAAGKEELSWHDEAQKAEEYLLGKGIPRRVAVEWAIRHADRKRSEDNGYREDVAIRRVSDQPYAPRFAPPELDDSLAETEQATSEALDLAEPIQAEHVNEPEQSIVEDETEDTPDIETETKAEEIVEEIADTKPEEVVEQADEIEAEETVEQIADTKVEETVEAKPVAEKAEDNGAETEPEEDSDEDKEEDKETDDTDKEQKIDAEKLKRQKDYVVNLFRTISSLVDYRDPILNQFSHIAQRMHKDEISPSDETIQAGQRFVDEYLRNGRGGLFKETPTSQRSELMDVARAMRKDLQAFLDTIK